MTSGLRSVIWQLLGWSGVFACALVFLLNYPAMKTAVGLDGSKAEATLRSGDAGQAMVATARDATVALKASDNGHYQAQVDINGRRTPVMVDTGASVVVLTYEDARRAGVYLKPSDFTTPVSTANGVTKVAPVMLDRVSVGDITVRNVRAAVADEGRLRTSLLGMSFLSRLERVDLRDGIMVLKD